MRRLWVQRLGGLGMAVFFGCLVFVDSDVAENPPWLIWPAAAAMLICTPLGWLLGESEEQAAGHGGGA